jgi:hypothetical protein
VKLGPGGRGEVVRVGEVAQVVQRGRVMVVMVGEGEVGFYLFICLCLAPFYPFPFPIPEWARGGRVLFPLLSNKRRS